MGFPQETDEEFEKSLAFAKKISFAETHIFPYSRRPTTVADKMKGQLDRKTKHSRAAQMADVCNETKALYLKSLVGTVQEVLFEKENKPSVASRSCAKLCYREDSKGQRGRFFASAAFKDRDNLVRWRVLLRKTYMSTKKRTANAILFRYIRFFCAQPSFARIISFIFPGFSLAL